MKLRTRFIVGFGSIGLLAIILGGSALLTYQIVRTQFGLLKADVIPGTLFMLNTKVALYTLVTDLERDVASGEVDEFDENQELIENLTTNAAAYTAHEAQFDEAERVIAVEFEQSIAQVIDTATQIEDLVRNNGSKEAINTLQTTLDENLADLEARVESHLEVLTDELNESTATVEQSINNGDALALIIAFLAVISGGAISLYLIRNILVPISAVQAGSSRIARGDYSHRLTIDRQDEIGQLATAF
ncbi:MAG TPA: HAMP domain-containing protein, partial [Phototrophicaceae bacterium]|nr:HAMP domain-containing protein [Phototrophicaceae bacterium]